MKLSRLLLLCGGKAALPIIDSFSPTSAEVGEDVVITGMLFTGATAVTINDVSVTAFTVDSDTQITATVPTGATTGKIVVTGLTGIGESNGNFTVENFVLTGVTTAPNQTITITRITPSGSVINMYWGDGNYSSIASGSAVPLAHQYAIAGTYSIRVEMPRYIVAISINSASLNTTIISTSNPLPAGLTTFTLLSQMTYNVNNSPLPTGLTTLYLSGVGSNFVYNANTNPLPSGLTTLHLSSVPGFTYNANTDPLPSGLTYLYLYGITGLTYNANTNPLPSGLTTLNLTNITGLTYNANTDPLPSGIAGTLYFYGISGLTWDINASQPCPAGVTSLVIILSNNVTLSEWTHNGIRSIQWESNCSAAKVDTILEKIWDNKANFTYATPSLDMLGNGNFAPNGVYQAASPPTTGKEFAYDLVNGAYTSAGPEWTVSVYLTTFATLGDSITSPNPGWTTQLMAAYGDGVTNRLINHAAGGATIIGSMDTQTSAAILDDADIIIMALGTNDSNGGDMGALQAEVEENIIEIKASNPRATVYYMNVLPRYDAFAEKGNIRTAIAAACTVQSVTCWDTYTTPWIAAEQTSDGLHPTNPAGHTVIMNEVLSRL